MYMKEIPGYPGQYATDSGDIFSLRSGTLKEKAMRLHNGYYRVNLLDGSKPAKFIVEPVHKIILETFVGKRPKGFVCRHLNGNPLDNRLENICWGTPKENVADALKHGTAACLRHGEKSIAAKLTDDNIVEIRKLFLEGVSQKDLGIRYGVTQRHINDIVNRKTRVNG